MSKFKKFRDLSGKEKSLFFEALILEVWVGLLLKVIPFRWIPRLFASPQFEAPTQEKSRTSSVGKETQSRHKASGRQSEVIELIRAAIQRAARVSPWKNRCLVSSLTARCMLRRRRIESRLSLGLAKGADGHVIAHAWLSAGDLEIIAGGGNYQELYSF